MNQNRILRHVIGLLLAAGAVPAIAQEAQPVAPPTIAPVAPPTVATPEAAPPAATAPARVFAAPSPVVQAVPPRAPVVEEPAPEPAAEAAPARRTARAAASPAAARARPARATPAAAAPATPEPAAAPVEAAPARTADITPAPVAEPAPAPVDTTVTTEPVAARETPWALLGLAAVAILGVIGFLLFRRRRSTETVYANQTYDETVLAADPPVVAAAAPMVVPAAQAAPVAVAADPAARPWIELGMRPVRAGTSADDATLEIELTIDNSSGMPAHNIRVSTWMMAASADQSDNERTLIDPPANTQVAECDLAPGEARQVGAVLTVPRSELGDGVEGPAFRPVIVADARYPLPDGGEGRISASFEVGTATGDRPDPIDVDAAPSELDAQLHGTLERA